MKGYIALHRQLLDSWIAEDPMALALWARILLEASHKDVTRPYKGGIYDLKKGELFFGLEHWSMKTGISREVIRKRIKIFEMQGMITYSKHPKISIISVCNWDNYQKTNTLTTGLEQADNRLTTGSQQEINNVNNLNNVNNKNLVPKKAERVIYDWELFQSSWNEFANNHGLASIRLVGDKLQRIIKDSFTMFNRYRKKESKEPYDFATFIEQYFDVCNDAITPFHKGLEESSKWKADAKYVFSKDVCESLMTTGEMKR